MRLAAFLSSSDQPYAERRRLLPLVLTIAAHLLILLLLLRLAPPFARMAKSGGQLISVAVAPEAQEQATRTKSVRKAERAPAAATPAPAVQPPKIELPNKAAPWVLTPGLERFDVRQVPPTPRASAAPSDASVADETAGSSNSDRPVAYGPAGQPLYAAQWYREPTDTETNYYLKYARPGPGFGTIACQTVARFHVDHCFEMEETPGSGLSRAVREAAWQFLVLPPRIGGRTMVGTWVVIRIDYTERKER